MNIEDMYVSQVVTLKHDTVKMTVSEIRDIKESEVIQVVTNVKDNRHPVTCIWFDKNHVLHEADFLPELLIKYL